MDALPDASVKRQKVDEPPAPAEDFFDFLNSKKKPKVDQEAIKREKHERYLASLRNKANWDKDDDTEEYVLGGDYALQYVKEPELKALLKEAINKEMASYRKQECQDGDCYAICYCKRKIYLKFKE